MYKRIKEKYDEEQTKKFIEKLDQLKFYSFCKSHAISYAKLVYRCAYFKYYKPKEFWLSFLNNSCSSYRKWVHFREANKVGRNIGLREY